MSSGTSSGDAANDAGKWAWAATENKWGKASATVDKLTASASVSASVSVNVGASLKVNASAQFSISAMVWSLNGLNMLSNGVLLSCIGAKGEAKASAAKVDGIINGLAALKNVAKALSYVNVDVKTKNALLLTNISALNLNV